MRMRSLSLLLVEDDVAHAEITRRNLEEFEVEVGELVHVTDGQAALDHLRTRELPDLMLLDLRLPRVDGLEVLSQIKSDERLKHIPVVVLTTSEAESDVRSAYDRGASGYIVKPAEFKQYLAIVRAFGQYWLRSNRYSSD